MNTETKQFIAEHFNDDVHLLSLQSDRYSSVDMPLAVRQIVGRQKIRTKVPLFFNNENILYPSKLSLEQSSSETTAIYKSSLCEGNILVDLTGGFAVDCCFLSTHFKYVIYVERNSELCSIASHNFKVLRKKNIEIINTYAEKYLEEMNFVDWIYIDPARRTNTGKKAVLLSDCEPNIAEISDLLLQKSNKVMIKLSPMMDISAVVNQLPETSEIHILAIENECKEVILIMDNSSIENLKIHTINFNKNGQYQLFEFFLQEENISNSIFTSELQQYLFEPNAAVMKSGAFKLVGNKFNLHKLHINTHLYTSNELIHDFPGRIFEIKQVWGNGKNEFKNLALHFPKANITTRNFPMTVEEIRKKLKIKDGGATYLFACTLSNEQKVVIECNKIV
ncbi:MAG: THUMP-like domain-containing protein [Paludibacter sp.]